MSGRSKLFLQGEGKNNRYFSPMCLTIWDILFSLTSMLLKYSHIFNLQIDFAVLCVLERESQSPKVIFYFAFLGY